MRAGETHCPLCGHGTLLKHIVVPSDVPEPTPDVHLLECGTCHFAWQWPLLRTPRASEEWYTQAYEKHAAGTYFDPARREQVANLELDFIEELARPGTLLDVGAGDGTFIGIAQRRGWNACGVEPARGRSSGGRFNTSGCPQLIRGTIEAIRPDRTFDVVTLWDVIEHVEDPEAVLRSARAHVKDTGWLVLETGNYLSAGRVEAAPRWWCHQVDHRWYFSPDTCVALMKKVGFRDFTHAPILLRPGARPVTPYPGPSRRQYLAQAIKHPLQAPTLFRKMQELRWLAQHRPAWAALEIFTIAARPAA